MALALVEMALSLAILIISAHFLGVLIRKIKEFYERVKR